MRISDWSSDVCSSDLVACDAPGPWLAVAAPIATWRRHLQMPGQGRPEIFPRACACPRDARRLLVRLARVTRGGMATGCDPARLVEAICAAVVEQQHDLSALVRSEEHTSELQSLMRISYAVFCLKKKKQKIPSTK